MLIDELTKAAETMCQDFCKYYERVRPTICGEDDVEAEAALEWLCEVCETCPMDGILGG